MENEELAAPSTQGALNYKMFLMRMLYDANTFIEGAFITKQELAIVRDCSVRSIELAIKANELPAPISSIGRTGWYVGPLREALDMNRRRSMRAPIRKTRTKVAA